MIESLIAFVLIVVILAPVWIPLAVATFPIWGLALFGIFSTDLNDKS